MSVFFHYGDFKTIIKRCPVTAVIVLLNTVMFIITIFTGGFTGNNLVRLGALYPPFVTQYKEYYRLFTMMFLHGSVFHYLSNTLFGLIIISAGLEKVIGSWRYTLIFLGSGLISSIIVTLVTANSVTIGASGAIYGVMGAFVVIVSNKTHLLTVQDQDYIKKLLLINLILTFLAPSISIPGHLGGLVGGILLSLILLNVKNRDFYYQ